MTEKFDLVLTLGFWQFAIMWLIIIAGVAFKSIPTLQSTVAGLSGCAVMVLGIWNFILIFMSRGTEGGAVCAGSYFKGNEAN